ncbi:unnamed protein product, partial [Scytosiphon promiscuus]
MGCSQSKPSTGLVLTERNIKSCDIPESDCLFESAQAVNTMHAERILNAISCKDDMTWDVMHARRSIFITPPDFVRDLCLFIVSRTNFIAVSSGEKGCCSGPALSPKIGHVYLLKHLKCPHGDTLDIQMAALPSNKSGGNSQMATNMMLQ